MASRPNRFDRVRTRARTAAAHADARLRRTSERLAEWRRAKVDPIVRPAAVALAPATTRVGDWRDRWMASEYAPATLARPGPAQYWTAGVLVGMIVAIIVFLAWFDWNYLRGPISRIASERLDREVEIQGDLDVDILRWTPEVHIEGLRIGGPDWANDRDTADIERLDVRVRALHLLAGRIEMPSIEAVGPQIVLVEDAEGNQSWDFSPGPDTSEGMDLPAMQRILIDGGQLTYENARRDITLNASIDATETQVDG